MTINTCLTRRIHVVPPSSRVEGQNRWNQISSRLRSCSEHLWNVAIVNLFKHFKLPSRDSTQSQNAVTSRWALIPASDTPHPLLDGHANCDKISETGYNKWACNTCPYEFPISKQMTSRTRLKHKEVDDVLGGEEMWKDADQTEKQCDKCDSNRAYFKQLQIRSADEPMTTFYLMRLQL
ncbi:hypothetical protein K439DRAFT_98956 [Ramaria rubella]|nr:hypothetical protein K439DRAFT_98956 [Ramaria rubella]